MYLFGMLHNFGNHVLLHHAAELMFKGPPQPLFVFLMVSAMEPAAHGWWLLRYTCVCLGLEPCPGNLGLGQAPGYHQTTIQERGG